MKPPCLKGNGSRHVPFADKGVIDNDKGLGKAAAMRFQHEHEILQVRIRRIRISKNKQE